MFAVEVIQLSVCFLFTLFLCRVIDSMDKKKAQIQSTERTSSRSCVKSPVSRRSHSVSTARTLYDYPYRFMHGDGILTPLSTDGIVCEKCTSNVWSDNVYQSAKTMRRKAKKNLFDESTQFTQPINTSLSKMSFAQEPECETLSMTFVSTCAPPKTLSGKHSRTGVSLRKPANSINKNTTNLQNLLLKFKKMLKVLSPPAIH